jgi:hypothetical protein
MEHIVTIIMIAAVVKHALVLVGITVNKLMGIVDM